MNNANNIISYGTLFSTSYRNGCCSWLRNG